MHPALRARPGHDGPVRRIQRFRCLRCMRCFRRGAVGRGGGRQQRRGVEGSHHHGGPPPARQGLGDMPAHARLAHQVRALHLAPRLGLVAQRPAREQGGAAERLGCRTRREGLHQPVPQIVAVPAGEPGPERVGQPAPLPRPGTESAPGTWAGVSVPRPAHARSASGRSQATAGTPFLAAQRRATSSGEKSANG